VETNMTRYLLLFLALSTWMISSFVAMSMSLAVEGSAIREIEVLLTGGFGLLTGAVFLSAAALAPAPKKREPEWGD
jgi:hypothetical protein